jgi:Rrf2 family protein
MLKLSKKADYGLIALRHLALHRPGASAKQIARQYGLPLPMLSKVLQRLARHGLLAPVYGTNGGYKLARDPRQISALEVVLAMDGPVILASCFDRQGRCTQSALCTVKAPLRRIHEGILRLLGGIKIAELSEPVEGPGSTEAAAPPARRHSHRARPSPARSGNEQADLPG